MGDSSPWFSHLLLGLGQRGGRAGTNHQLLIPDLLGFGDSDKPAGHQYTLVEQADLIEALWHHFGIDHSALIAHDIGGSVAQELLARHNEGRWPCA